MIHETATFFVIESKSNSVIYFNKHSSYIVTLNRQGLSDQKSKSWKSPRITKSCPVIRKHYRICWVLRNGEGSLILKWKEHVISFVLSICPLHFCDIVRQKSLKSCVISLSYIAVEALSSFPKNMAGWPSTLERNNYKFFSTKSRKLSPFKCMT